MKCEIWRFFESHRTQTYYVDQLYMYMKNHKLLDPISKESFKFILMVSQSDQRKNIRYLKHLIRLAERNRKCKCSDWDLACIKDELGCK